MKTVEVTLPTQAESIKFMRHPLAVSLLTLFLGWLCFTLYEWNTTDNEVAPLAQIAADNAIRLDAEEVNTRQVAAQLQIQAVQGAFSARKWASADLRKLETKPRDDWTPQDQTEYMDAESRLEYNQKVIDHAMGLQGDLE